MWDKERAPLVAQLVKNLPAMQETLVQFLRRSVGEGIGYPLQYSGLKNSMDCIVHGVTKSQTRLSDFHFHFFRVTQESQKEDNPQGTSSITLYLLNKI